MFADHLCRLRADLSSSNNTSSNNVSLECHEQMTALSPTLSLNYGEKLTKKQASNLSIVSGYKKSVSTLPHGLKRKNNKGY